METFHFTDKIKIERGEVYYGPAPFDMPDRNVVGKHVVIDGRVAKIVGLESYAMLPGPMKGDMIGLLVEWVTTARDTIG